MEVWNVKIEDLAYRVAGEALNLLEKRYHYKISDDHKKDIQSTVRKNLGTYLADAQKAEAAEAQK